MCSKHKYMKHFLQKVNFSVLCSRWYLFVQMLEDAVLEFLPPLLYCDCLFNISRTLFKLFLSKFSHYM
jgi:hypothetical protein